MNKACATWKNSSKHPKNDPIFGEVKNSRLFMKTIRASEIGTYLYCRRAWWYQRQGIESQNQAEMAAGSQMHRQHGRSVFLNGLLRLAAYLLLLAALVLLTMALVSRYI